MITDHLELKEKILKLNIVDSFSDKQLSRIKLYYNIYKSSISNMMIYFNKINTYNLKDSTKPSLSDQIILIRLICNVPFKEKTSILNIFKRPMLDNPNMDDSSKPINYGDSLKYYNMNRSKKKKNSNMERYRDIRNIPKVTIEDNYKVYKSILYLQYINNSIAEEVMNMNYEFDLVNKEIAKYRDALDHRAKKNIHIKDKTDVRKYTK